MNRGVSMRRRGAYEEVKYATTKARNGPVGAEQIQRQSQLNFNHVFNVAFQKSSRMGLETKWKFVKKKKKYYKWGIRK